MDGKAPERALANTDHHFLIGAMAYWEACMSFVVDQPKNALHYLAPFGKTTETTYIHMLCGISLPLLVILGNVGVCVRQNRALRRMVDVGWKDRNGFHLLASEVEQDALELAKQAFNYKIPTEVSFDQKTLGPSVCRQVKAFAQMCKFAVLLELQRNFPGLMQPNSTYGDDTSSGARVYSPTFELLRRSHELAGAMLVYAEHIPEGSTCGLYQTILLIICGSALRTSNKPLTLFSDEPTLHDQLGAELLSTSARSDEIEKRRAFIRRRLRSNCASFGLGQVYSRAELLLEHIWGEFDAGTIALDVRHWIDIMADHRLETFFG
jgi:hypothetical protein